MKIKTFVLVILLPMLFVGNVQGATRTSIAAGGNWNSTTTWGGSAVPKAGDNVIITSIVTLSSGNDGVCTNLTINSGGSLTIEGGKTLTASGYFYMLKPAANYTNTINVDAGILNVSGLTRIYATSGGTRRSFFKILNGGVVNLGAFRTHGPDCSIEFAGIGTMNISGVVTISGSPEISAGNGTINYSRSGNQKVFTGTYYNLTLSGTGTNAKTITTASTTVNNLFTLEETAKVTNSPTYGATATLRYNTTTDRDAGAEWLATFEATGGVVIDNLGVITTNGNKIFSLNVPLIINANATLAPAAGNTFSFGGDLINNGTWSSSTGDVTIALDKTSQNIGAISTSGTVTMTKTVGTATFTGNINGGGLTLSGSGSLNLGSGLTHIISGDLAGTVGILNGNTSTIRIGGAFTANITFNANTGTVSFIGTGSQTIPAFNFYDLNGIGGPRTLVGAGIIGIANAFIPGIGPYTVLGSTVSFNGTGSQTIPTFTFNDLILSNAGAKTINSAVSVKNITIETGPALNLNSTGGGLLTIY